MRELGGTREIDFILYYVRLGYVMIGIIDFIYLLISFIYLFYIIEEIILFHIIEELGGSRETDYFILC